MKRAATSPQPGQSFPEFMDSSWSRVDVPGRECFEWIMPGGSYRLQVKICPGPSYLITVHDRTDRDNVLETHKTSRLNRAVQFAYASMNDVMFIWHNRFGRAGVEDELHILTFPDDRGGLYDAFEIHPCHEELDEFGNSIYIEQVDESAADITFWTLYGHVRAGAYEAHGREPGNHVPEGGLEALEDYPTKAMAMRARARVLEAITKSKQL